MGRADGKTLTLKQYILICYGLKTDDQVQGGPAWTETDRYDIVAKLEPADKPLTSKENEDKVLDAMRNLLADRFHLEVRKEERPVSGYTLVTAKGGPKLKPAATPERHSNRWYGNKLTSISASMKIFADLLTRITGSPVVDGTGIAGEFDLELEWSSDDTPVATAKAPPISVAVQEQLGLKLEPRKAVKPVLVVVSAQRPAAN